MVLSYRPTDGDPRVGVHRWRPRTAFLMTQLGAPVPAPLGALRARVELALERHGFEFLDADSQTTGQDFLLKIWDLACSVPLGVALLHEDMRETAVMNTFYELGLMHAYGKATLVVKSPGARIPSDFVRTEYVEDNEQLGRRVSQFMGELAERADYYEVMADQLRRNPLLALDYLQRAYLLTGKAALKRKARTLYEEAGLGERDPDSLEALLLNFARR